MLFNVSKMLAEFPLPVFGVTPATAARDHEKEADALPRLLFSAILASLPEQMLLVPEEVIVGFGLTIRFTELLVPQSTLLSETKQR